MRGRLRGLSWQQGHLTGAAWTGLDQLLSSISNLVVSLAIARAAGAEGLGMYTVAFAIYLLVFGLQRALVNDPLLTIPLEKAERDDDRAPLALGAAVAYLVPVAVVVLVAGLLMGSTPVVVLAPFLPLVCLQDVYRYVFFRRREPAKATLLDGLWVVVALAGWVFVDATGSPSVAVAVWGAGGALGALIGWILTRSAPSSLRAGVGWWMREAKRLGGFLGLDQALSAVFQQVVTLGLAGILGSGDLGRLRGAQIVLGPVGLILTAFQVFLLPRMAGRRSALTPQAAAATSLAAGAFTLLGAAVLWLAAPWLTPLVFGEMLDLPPILLLAVGAAMTIRAVSIGPMLQLKAQQRGSPIAVARLVTGSIGVPIVLVTAALFGLVPATWAQCVPAFGFTVMVALALRRRGRNGLSTDRPVSEPASSMPVTEAGGG